MPRTSYSSLHSRGSDINASMGSDSRIEDPIMMTSIDSKDMMYVPEMMKTIGGRKTFSHVTGRATLEDQKKGHREAIDQWQATKLEHQHKLRDNHRLQDTDPRDMLLTVFLRQLADIRARQGIHPSVRTEHVEHLHDYKGRLYVPRPRTKYSDLDAKTRDYRTQIQYPEGGFTILDAPAHVKKFAKSFRNLSDKQKAFHSKYPERAAYNHAVNNPIRRAIRNDPNHPAHWQGGRLPGMMLQNARAMRNDSNHPARAMRATFQNARAIAALRARRAGSVASTTKEVQRPISVPLMYRSARRRSVGRKSAGRKSVGRKSAGRKSIGRKSARRKSAKRRTLG